MKVLGLDACRGKWLAVAVDDGHFDGARLGSDAAGLVAAWPDAAAIGVDIPTGLPETPLREADRAARQFVGERRSSVFPTFPSLVLEFLERSIVVLLQEHTRLRAAETVQGYVNWRLRNFQNATRQVIIDTVGAFSAVWRADLDAFIDDQRGGAIGSLMKQRHRIAHGDWSDISYVRVNEYYASVVEVVDRIADLTDPAAGS